jgi:hypothetical protein
MHPFLQTVKLYRSVMSKETRARTRRRKIGFVPYPLGHELSYARYITQMTKLFIEKISQTTNVYIGLKFKNDANDFEELERLYNITFEDFYAVYMWESGLLAKELMRRAELIFGADSSYFQKQIKIVIGVPGSIEAPWWEGLKQAWVQENYNLMKGLGKEYVDSITKVLMQGITEGRSEAWIVDRIQAIAEGLAGYRARRIARDQVGKLNSLIMKEQCLSLGMETFWWKTIGDELVRGDPSGKYKNAVPSHYKMDNLLCSWLDNTIYSDDRGKTWKQKTATMELEHPGMAIMCRCTATPSWTLMMEAVDKELGDTI